MRFGKGTTKISNYGLQEWTVKTFSNEVEKREDVSLWGRTAYGLITH